MSAVAARRMRPVVAGHADAIDPRESMRVLPSFLQLPLTLLTGRAFTGQRPLRLSATYHLAGALASMSLGIAVSVAGLRTDGPWLLLLLLPGWAMTLHAMRNLRMMIFHQCSHRNMYARAGLDAFIGRALASVLVVQNYELYSREHVGDHHSVHHMTLRDPTVQAFLVTLGMRPGMTRSQMWRRLAGRLLSPRFHVRFAIARVRSFMHGATTGERLTAIVLYGAIVVLAALTGAWLTVLVVWFVPLVPLFQASNTLRLCVKHTFPGRDAGERRGKAYQASLTNAIFLGEPAPAAGGAAPATVAAWAHWFARMAFVHLPSRYLVLTGDTVCHDYHHRHPVSRRWFDYIFARQEDVDSGHCGWPPYREAWGLVSAITLVFDSLSTADPNEYDVERVGLVSQRELFNAFDD
jgi:fatty acid desaturase